MKYLICFLSLMAASAALAADPAELVKLRKTWQNSQAEAKKSAETIFRTKNIKANTRRFMTHHDVHRTISNLLESKKGGDKAGYDLIHDLLPEQRSGAEAQVPPQWCNCFVPKKVQGCTQVVDTQKGTIKSCT